MPCKHLHELYALCQSHQLKLSSSDLIRIVCPKCGVEEVCPSMLMEHYEAQHPSAELPPTPPEKADEE
jgi:hypothetical protein